MTIWQRRRKLRELEEELAYIDLFERLYESLSKPTESERKAHITRVVRRAEVLAEMEELGGVSKQHSQTSANSHTCS
jgi:hypothetical protein